MPDGRRPPNACRRWNTAFCTSAVLWSDVRADFSPLSRGLQTYRGEMAPYETDKLNRRCESLAAWLACRASLVRSLHIIWPGNDHGSRVSLPSVLQQHMPRLASLTIQCSDHGDSRKWSAKPCLRFAEVACLATHQPQLTALSFGRLPLCMEFGGLLSPPYDEPPLAWLASLQRLQRLDLPGFFLRPSTVASLGRLTGLASLALHIDSHAARQRLQDALGQLPGLTRLSVAQSRQRHPAVALVAGEGAAVPDAPLQVGELPRLAELHLSGCSVQGLAAAPSLTWLQLHGDFQVAVSLRADCSGQCTCAGLTCGQGMA